MNGSIYLIKNSINNKVYIGQTIQPVEKRFHQHLRLSATNSKQAIHKAMKGIGKNNFSFEILETNLKTYDELNEKEEFYIRKYNSIAPNGYNLCPGGAKWRKLPKYFNEDQILDIRKRYEKGLSTREIAAEYRTSHNKILSILHSCNVEVRSKENNLPDRTSVICYENLKFLFCDQKKKTSEIAKIYGVDPCTVRRAIRRFDLREYNAGRKSDT